MEKLFEDKIRTDKEPGNYNDNTFDFIDRSAIEEVVAIRETLNNWYSQYPLAERVELKQRILKTFPAAFYELFIHELFIKQGFLLEIHPTIPGSTKRPDFLAKKNGVEFYVEAKDAADKSEADVKRENQINTIHDTLNKIKSPNFLLYLKTLSLKSLKQPSLKPANNHIEKELAKLDPDEVYNTISLKGRDYIETIRFEDDDLLIEVEPIPLPLEHRGKNDGRAIGMHGIESFVGNNEETITSALEKKATRYGKLDKPYLICVNFSNKMGANEYNVMDALFGSLAITWSTDPKNKDERWMRSGYGFFRSRRGPHFTRVSGVLITNVHIGSIFNPGHWLVKHPSALRELDFSLFKLPYMSLVIDKVESTPGLSAKEILY